jgi:hypothetical protein
VHVVGIVVIAEEGVLLSWLLLCSIAHACAPTVPPIWIGRIKLCPDQRPVYTSKSKV